MLSSHLSLALALLLLFPVLLAAATKPATNPAPQKWIHPGEIWPDTAGNHIQAHGGGILHHDGTFYGLAKTAPATCPAPSATSPATRPRI